MKIISFDVGIKNLACCILESNDDHHKIIYWDVINLANPNVYPPCCCNCKCKVQYVYTPTKQYYCTKHSKKNNNNHNLIPSELQNIKKEKQSTLFSLAESYHLQPQKPVSKKQLLELLNNFIENNYIVLLPKEAKASTLDLITIGRQMKQAFEKHINHHGHFDHVIIENQISPIANRMKTIQGMIAYHFVMLNHNSNIQFISASNKLNTFTDDKIENYSDRKKAAVILCKQILEKYNYFHDYKNYLDKNGKKDDLADCFLQLLYYAKMHINIL